MDRAKYFDNAATTPVAPEVFTAMEPFLKENFGNASSIHARGSMASNAVEQAREHLADLIGAGPDEIVFTSGATEANNWILRAFTSLSVSPFEHPSVRLTGQALEAVVLKNDGWILEDSDTDLTSIQTVNHETGAMITAPKIKLRHADATQAVGKINTNVSQYDFASMSAHKFYGPKGIGALYIKDCAELPPLMHGGSHEHGMRSGTLNVPGIAGMGAAAKLAKERIEEDTVNVRHLRNEVKRELEKISDVLFVEAEQNSPYILSTCFAGVEGESVVIALDAKGYATSAGAACSSGSGDTSPVLKAYGLSEEVARGAVRVSFGRYNTIEAAEGLCREIREAVANLRKLNV